MGREASKSLSETAQCITGRVGAEVFMLQVHPSTPQTSAATPPITFQDPGACSSTAAPEISQVKQV